MVSALRPRLRVGLVFAGPRTLAIRRRERTVCFLCLSEIVIEAEPQSVRVLRDSIVRF